MNRMMPPRRWQRGGSKENTVNELNMTTEGKRTVGIVGLGLIGGSMAIDLKRRGFADRILGVERDPVNAVAAQRVELADELLSLEDCIRRSDIVVIAIPVGSAVPMLVQILDRFRELDAREKIVIDTCSTKSQAVRAARYHPFRRQYVATHPMAGTEYSGPWAAEPNLFDGRACIFADAEESDPKAVKTIEMLYGTLNMRPIYMNADAHDVHAAYVSHISHVTSFALALTVLEKEQDEKHIFDLASGGFSSTVRLAKSSADMWTPILRQNRDNVLHVLDTFLKKMRDFRDAIADSDEARITGLIHEANRIKKILR